MAKLNLDLEDVAEVKRFKQVFHALSSGMLTDSMSVPTGYVPVGLGFYWQASATPSDTFIFHYHYSLSSTVEFSGYAQGPGSLELIAICIKDLKDLGDETL